MNISNCSLLPDNINKVLIIPIGHNCTVTELLKYYIFNGNYQRNPFEWNTTSN